MENVLKNFWSHTVRVTMKERKISRIIHVLTSFNVIFLYNPNKSITFAT